MNEEIPIPNPSLTPEEQSTVAKLSDADLQFIDDTILANAAASWLKVAQVAGRTQDALEHRHPGLSCVFYAQRVSRLVEEGRLMSRGNLSYMRFSEVRLTESSSGNEPQKEHEG